MKKRTTSEKSEATKRWRHNSKRRVFEAFGSKCCICGYDKCPDAIDFHHLDPSSKEAALSKLLAYPSGWTNVTKEMQKCVALCANCHREVHAGISVVPDDAQRFDESLIQYPAVSNDTHDDCPTCGEKKIKKHKYCSRKCIVRTSIVDWANVDLAKLMEEYDSYEAIGRLLGVTGAAVKRREQRLQNRK